MLTDLKIYLVTWNVVSRPPINDLSAMLGLEEPIDVQNMPDIYGIGLQEVSCKPQDLIISMIIEDSWTMGFKEILSRYNYVKVKQIRLQGIELFLFAKREHVLHLRNIQTSYTKAGFKGMWGNKGGVSIRLAAYGCSICIVNSHLGAFDEYVQQRIDDYNLIIDKQRFIDPLTENIITHDYTFWIGDLNFRIDDYTIEEIANSIKNGTIKSLLNKDQLRMVMKTGQAFSEFVETPPPFAPTYKFIIDGDDYNTEKRKPAWTDRILFRSTPNAYENVTLGLKQLHYTSHPQYNQSDHKPVSSSFTIKVFANPPQHMVKFHPLEQWKVNKDSVAWYQFSEGEPTNWDWISLNRADFPSLDDYIAYVWAPAHPTRHIPPLSREMLEDSQILVGDITNSPNARHRPLRSQKPWYRVVFADQTILIPGTYRLFYQSSQFGNILGISDAFEILPEG